MDGSKPVKDGKLHSFSLKHASLPWRQRHEEGKALRERAPRNSHGEWKPAASARRNPLEILRRNNIGRQAEFVPLRMGRMAASPFAFLRGSACIMAADLASTPLSGLSMVIDGDAHLSNFGMYGTPQREVVFDLNDFDEALVGPWEWDLKRLTASINVAGRSNGLNARERAAAVRRCVLGYRQNITRIESMGVLDVWYLHAYPGRTNPLIKVNPKSKAVFAKTLSKALRTDNRTLLPKVADRLTEGDWRFRNDPPVFTTVDKKTYEKVTRALDLYSTSLSPERRFMLSRYHVADVAHRIVGVGSVGTRAYLVLLFGSGDDDPLFLQVKEACTPAHAPYLGPPLPGFEHNGKRVVVGQRALQASSDPMLGYTCMDGRDYYVRQMKNLKASIPIDFLTGETFHFYGWACGVILARAHARTGDPARIAGYCGNSDELDSAFAKWAERYGDQTEQDHATLVTAIRSGTVKAITEGFAEE